MANKLNTPTAPATACVVEGRDEAQGFLAFPFETFQANGARFPRCPFRRPERVASWNRGLHAAHVEALSIIGAK